MAEKIHQRNMLPIYRAPKGNGMIPLLISKLLLGLTALVAGAGLIFLVLTVRRSTLPYNSEGNYFDGAVNYHEHMVMFYGILAGASLSCAIILFAIRRLFQRWRQVAPGKHRNFR